MFIEYFAAELKKKSGGLPLPAFDTLNMKL